MNIIEIAISITIAIGFVVIIRKVLMAEQNERDDRDYTTRDRLMAEIEADNVKADARAEEKRFPTASMD